MTQLNRNILQRAQANRQHMKFWITLFRGLLAITLGEGGKSAA